MSAILESLANSLDSASIKKMSNELGEDQEKTTNAIGAALPVLLGALKRNAVAPQGAQSLLGALSNDHDGSVLDRLGDFLSNRDYEQPRGGGSILNHVFGGNLSRVEKGVSQSSGLRDAASSKLLKMLAPLVLGAVGKQVRSQNLGAGDLSGYLNKESEQLERKDKKFSLLGKFLDQDGDGDFDFNDIAKLGVGLLFKRK